MHAHKEFLVWPIFFFACVTVFIISDCICNSCCILETLPSTNEACCYFWYQQLHSCFTITGSFFCLASSHIQSDFFVMICYKWSVSWLLNKYTQIHFKIFWSVPVLLFGQARVVFILSVCSALGTIFYQNNFLFSYYAIFFPAGFVPSGATNGRVLL